MSDEPMIECAIHGRRTIALACTHIAQGLLEETTPGFVIAPQTDGPDDFAWCDECETMVEGLGGDWNEDASDRADFKLLCADCYAEAKGLAVVAGRFRNISGKFGL